MMAPARQAVRHGLERIHASLLNLLGGKSVGVRAIVVHPDGRILLVRHTYRDGWHTPGGGVANGESPQAAIRRELREEVGLTITSDPVLFAVFRNRWRGRHDYPILFIVREFDGEPHVQDAREIAEVAWHHPDHLPAEVTDKTKLRIMEYLSGASSRDDW